MLKYVYKTFHEIELKGIERYNIIEKFVQNNKANKIIKTSGSVLKEISKEVESCIDDISSQINRFES